MPLFSRCPASRPGFFLSGFLSQGGVRGFDVEKNIEDMVKYNENAWRLGAVDAGYVLFGMYYTGGGVEKNKGVALRYLLDSARLGFIRSQRQLGVAYRGLTLRDLVDKDEAAAFEWFLLAAEQGDRTSATNVAVFLHEGRGVDKDDDEAFRWFSRTEDMPYGGDTSGFRGLAAFYEKGIGTDIDLVQAYKYYDLLSPGSAPDKARLEEQMTPEQIREAIRLSRQWQEEHNIFVPSYYGLEYQEDGTFQ
ncbi:sel1 repeat family protein [Halomonas sp. YLB-10]|uniref:tetratricopeptide repeat protein n=1 Tax=Halomonas sp. YLB-10 TaxID=2483111 RepID=UPI000F5F9877|nr:tetratricopeptide repeat protein [Halomonas sp. YLB-10]RQW72954.1 sel1 repeat family protein [Halomonas sp. YLB-10]